MERKVVVPVHLKFFRNAASIVAAHSEELGLTGYGENEAAASKSFKKVFGLFVHVSRTEGFLEDILDRLKVDWKWEDEYQDDYEDVSGLRPTEGDKFIPVQEDDKEAVTIAA